jgi:tricorn protease
MTGIDPQLNWLVPKVSTLPKQVLAPLDEKVQAQAFCRFPALWIGADKALLAFSSGEALWICESNPSCNEFSAPRKLLESTNQVSRPVFSPDGKKIAYTSKINSIFELTIQGNQAPKQLTAFGTKTYPVTYLSDDALVLSSIVHSQDAYAFMLYIKTKEGTKPITLSEAHDAAFSEDRKTLFFTKNLGNDPAKRYQGGWTREIWSWTDGEDKCKLLTKDFKGHCFNPMFWNQRLYFLRHFEGVTNIFSMDSQGQSKGQSITQHTFHDSFDIREASLCKGMIAYRCGTSLFVFHCESNKTQPLNLYLTGSAELAKERFINNAKESITYTELSTCGKKVLVTCRGQIFLVGVEEKMPEVAVTGPQDIGYQMAKFIGETDAIVAVSDQGGEQAFWKIENQKKEKISNDLNGRVINYSISPSGKTLFCNLWRNKCLILDTTTKQTKAIEIPCIEIEDSLFSPNSKMIAIVSKNSETDLRCIYLYQVKNGTLTLATSDRTYSKKPFWTKNSQHLFFTSKRHFDSAISHGFSPFGQGAHFSRMEHICHLPLARPIHSWFQAESVDGSMDLNDLFTRVEIIDGKPQDISSFFATETHLFSLYDNDLWTLDRKDAKREWKKLYSNIESAKLSAKGEHILLKNDDGNYFVAPANGEVVPQKTINLNDWKILVCPKVEWKQRFEEAWRNQRDLFHDPKMHGIDWNGIKKKYLPHLDCVSSNTELKDLIEQMIGELGALHHWAIGGDDLDFEPKVTKGFLGATFEPCATGFKIQSILKTDPDLPSMQSPLSTFDQAFKDGDVIERVNGQKITSIDEALIEMEGKKILLTLDSGKTVPVIPHSKDKEKALLHANWIYQNFQKVATLSKNQFGYIQLKNMEKEGLNEFCRQYYSQLGKKGIIFDLRRNTGGSVDNFLIEKLLASKQCQFKDRDGVWKDPTRYAFEGALVALSDGTSCSDAETFLYQFRAFKLGPIVGSRTWGGGIWLEPSLGDGIDGSQVAIPNYGSYDTQGRAIIEGTGIEPDIQVVNDPRQEYDGRDAVLETAVQVLLDRIAKQ